MKYFKSCFNLKKVSRCFVVSKLDARDLIKLSLVDTCAAFHVDKGKIPTVVDITKVNENNRDVASIFKCEIAPHHAYNTARIPKKQYQRRDLRLAPTW